MAKFSGNIGFGVSSEVVPGVWKETITTRKYYGDVIRDTRKNQGNDRVIENFNISNQFSIVSDSYAINNLEHMRYLEYLGIKWKILSFEVQFPRLILSVGDVYNGEKA